MSGTRKIEKFELDAVTKSRDGAAGEEGVVDLPARPFEPRRSDGGVDVPDLALAKPALDKPTSAPHIEAPSPATAGWSPGEWVPPQEAPPESSPGPTSQDPDALRTRLARKFVVLADSFTEAFKEFGIGAGNYAVELTQPQGMSTGGGAQALQHIRLRPRRQGHPVLVAGVVNQVERRAELRDFDHLSIVHELRFRGQVDVTSQEWEQFLRKAEVVLNAAGIQSLRTPPPRELLDQRRSAGRISKRALGLLGVVLILAALVVWRVVVVLTAQP